MREFTLGVGSAAISGTTTLNFLKAAAAPSVNLEFLRFWIGQSSSTTSAQQRCVINFASGSCLVVATSPSKLKIHDPVTSVIVGGASGAAGTCGVNCTNEPGASGTSAIINDVFNILNGWLMIPTPAETIVLPAGQTSGIAMATASNPAATTAWAWGWTFREV